MNNAEGETVSLCCPVMNNNLDQKGRQRLIETSSVEREEADCFTVQEGLEANNEQTLLDQQHSSGYNSSKAMRFFDFTLAKLSTSKSIILLASFGFFFRRTIIYRAFYPFFRLVFGTLYPAYASYKGVRTKNTKEYVKWMMYWIVFALFTCVETFTDIFLSWFPFYYEIKIILVIWLLSPATKGSSILYRKFVHPMLSSREQEIDEYISKAKEQSYKQFLDIGQKGVTALMQTAIKGGGGIVNQLKKSYSLSDLSDPADGFDEADDILVTDPRLIRRRKQGRSPHRSSSASSASVYFSEVNVGIGRGAGTEVRSIEDISSGYSSGEGLYAAQQPGKIQARESIASHRANSLTRSRSTRVTRSGVLKKTNITSDDSDDNEVFDTNIIFFNDKARKINTLPETHDSSSSETEFFDTPEMIGFDLHGKILISTDRVEKNNQIVDGSTIIPSKLSVVKDNPIDCDATGANLRIPCALGYDTDSEITACKSDISTPPSSSLRFNLTKLSSALSSLYPLRSSAFSDADKHNVESVNLESNYSNPDRSKNVVNDNVTAQMQSEIPACSAPTKIANVGENDDEIKRLEVVDRGGKYNKKHAPLPPRPPKRDAYNLPIKATLVLQPGVVRSMESLNKEVFLNYSPKMRRRSRNASPASRSSKSSESSSSSSKTENALSKMLRLPKRMAQLNIPGKIKDKRHSWGEFFHGKRLNASGKKMHSRSTSSLDAIAENPATDVSKPIQRTASQVSIRSLTDSPLAHRRTSQVQPYLVLKSQQKRKLYETQV